VIVLELNLYDQDLEIGEMHKLGLAFTPALGSYKGTVSRSYIVDAGMDGNLYGQIDTSKLYKILDLATKHGQESVLILESGRGAKLYYLASQDIVELGQLVAISKAQADATQNWTLVNGTYYGTEA
jgi:acetyl-CoA carboxylase carboxyltransferase component